MDLVCRCRRVTDRDQNVLANQRADEVGDLIIMRRQRYLADQTATRALPFSDLVKIGRPDMFTGMRTARAVLGREIWTLDMDERDHPGAERILSPGCGDGRQGRKKRGAGRGDQRGQIGRDAELGHHTRQLGHPRWRQPAVIEVKAAKAIDLQINQACGEMRTRHWLHVDRLNRHDAAVGDNDGNPPPGANIAAGNAGRRHRLRHRDRTPRRDRACRRHAGAGCWPDSRW